MSSVIADIEAIPVHVANAHEMAPAPAGNPDYEVNCKTFTLKTGQTSGDPNGAIIARILDRDKSRKQAIVVVASGTVYLCHSSAQAESAAAGSVGTLGGPQDGFIAVAGVPIPPLCTTDPLWAVVPSDKASSGALVSVIAERRRGLPMPTTAPIWPRQTQITLDGTGSGTATLGPSGHGITWTLATVSVKTAQTVSTGTCQCQIFAGDDTSPVNFVDGTFSGDTGDSTSAAAGTQIRLGKTVSAVWSGGVPGDIATLTLTGTMEIP